MKQKYNVWIIQEFQANLLWYAYLLEIKPCNENATF